MSHSSSMLNPLDGTLDTLTLSAEVQIIAAWLSKNPQARLPGHLSRCLKLLDLTTKK